MALNLRQQFFYTQTCDIWRKAVPAVGTGPVAGTIADPSGWIKVYTALKWRDQTTRYNSNIGGLGRQDEPNFLTRNDAHFEVSVDIRDGDVIVETTAGVTPSLNAFVAVGQGEVRTSAVANYCHADLKRTMLDPALKTAGGYA